MRMCFIDLCKRTLIGNEYHNLFTTPLNPVCYSSFKLHLLVNFPIREKKLWINTIRNSQKVGSVDHYFNQGVPCVSSWNAASSWLGFCVAFTSELEFRHCAFWLLPSTCKVIRPLPERSKIYIQHADSEEIFQHFGPLMLLPYSKCKRTKMSLFHPLCDPWRFTLGDSVMCT